MVGEDWVRGILKRHGDLSLRKPKTTYGVRARGFNRVAVTNFFNLLYGQTEVRCHSNF